MSRHIVRAIVWLLIMAIPFASQVSAQQSKQEKQAAKEALIKKKIQDRRFTFIAETALPMRGSMRMLTPGYDLRVTRDSVVAYLPYFGRAYSAPLNLMGGGVQFTSVKFDYKIEERKKGGWNIIIKPNDVDDNQQLNLTVFTNGSASVQATSNNRQAIQFNGYISMGK